MNCDVVVVEVEEEEVVVVVEVVVKYMWICIARLRADASKALRYRSHSLTCKQHHICLYSQSQNITAL